MDVRGISAIVTGGASGLGAATARALHRLGATVVIADVHAEAGEALAGELGDGALFVPTDVTDPAAVERAIDAAVRRAPLGVLVNCAGIGLAQKVLGKEGPMTWPPLSGSSASIWSGRSTPCAWPRRRCGATRRTRMANAG